MTRLATASFSRWTLLHGVIKHATTAFTSIPTRQLKHPATGCLITYVIYLCTFTRLVARLSLRSDVASNYGPYGARGCIRRWRPSALLSRNWSCSFQPALTLHCKAFYSFILLLQPTTRYFSTKNRNLNLVNDRV